MVMATKDWDEQDAQLRQLGKTLRKKGFRLDGTGTTMKTGTRDYQWSKKVGPDEYIAIYATVKQVKVLHEIGTRRKLIWKGSANRAVRSLPSKRMLALT